MSPIQHPGITLAPGRERSLLRRHPWVFSGAVSAVQGDPARGETIRVCSSDGKFLAWAAYSPLSQIRARVWSFNPEDRVDSSFFAKRLENAVLLRQRLGYDMDPFSAFRLVHGESDGLPGCIIDCYGHYVVCQFLSAGAEYWKNTLIAQLLRLYPQCLGILERSDADSRRKEGLDPIHAVLFGEIPDTVEIRENGMRLYVDLHQGHKTGYYLDQREARLAVRQYASGRRVLNAFSYTGGFGIQALLGGARHVTHADLSESALKLARANHSLNRLDDARAEWINADVFELLRRYRDQKKQFDLIILDPPKFADSQNQLAKASRGYKDINLLAIKLLAPGGLLFTFSCSGLMTPELFHKVVASAASDAGRDIRILRRFDHPSDHPVSIYFPEGHYLKGLLLTV